MNKNDEVTVKIEDMTETGEGVGHVKSENHGEGLTLFVKDAVIGDEVLAGITKVKKTYCYARTIEVKKASADRITPRCPVSRACGGCQLQALSYPAQLEFKRRKVESCFSRIGGFELSDSPDAATTDNTVHVSPVLGMSEPWNYRNKAQFPVGKDKNGEVVAGFYAGHTHSIIPCSVCAIEFEGHEKILAAVLDYMREAKVSAYDEEQGSGAVRHVLMRKGFATGEIMVVIVTNTQKLKSSELLINKLREIEFEDGKIVSIEQNINTEKTNVILGRECRTLWGKDHITDKIGDVSFNISALSFYQVNPAQTKVLYDLALSACFEDGDENKVIWDMYCGIGTISLFLAKRAKQVYGVEIVPAAIENAKANARLNGMENAEFFVGAAEDVVPALYKKNAEKYRADIVVVDPPRKGCDPALLETIGEMAPEKVVYVSCDPATLARDCRILADKGYTVQSVQPVDMFPHGVGVENVVSLKKSR